MIYEVRTSLLKYIIRDNPKYLFRVYSRIKDVIRYSDDFAELILDLEKYQNPSEYKFLKYKYLVLHKSQINEQILTAYFYTKKEANAFINYYKCLILAVYRNKHGGLYEKIL